jgi:hypothetical protein
MYCCPFHGESAEIRAATQSSIVSYSRHLSGRRSIARHVSVAASVISSGRQQCKPGGLVSGFHDGTHAVLVESAVASVQCVRVEHRLPALGMQDAAETAPRETTDCWTRSSGDPRVRLNPSTS